MEFAIFRPTSVRNQVMLVVVATVGKNQLMLVAVTVDVEENSGLTLI
jgi:hypothetical protein